MAVPLFTNNASSTLAATITAVQTTIAVQSGDAAEYPSPSGGDWFMVTVQDGGGNIEIMKCTARSGVTLTVTRGQESTTAFAFTAGARVDLRLTALALTDFATGVAANTAKFDTFIDNSTAETTPATGDLLPMHDVSVPGQRKMTFENFLKIVNALTALTSPATGDSLAVYDSSASAARKITLLNLWKVVNSFTAVTTLAVGDVLPIYDASASAIRKVTLANLFKVINGFTEDTSPDGAADFVPVYDVSAGTMKKVKPDNLAGGGGVRELIATATASNDATIEFTGLSSLFNRYVVEISSMAPVTDATTLNMRTSTNNGIPYDSAASDYSWAFFRASANGANDTLGNRTDAQIKLTDTTGNDTNQTIAGSVSIYAPSDTSFTKIMGDLIYNDGVGRTIRTISGGERVSAASVDAIQFLMSSGNISSGKFKLYGIT